MFADGNASTMSVNEGKKVGGGGGAGGVAAVNTRFGVAERRARADTVCGSEVWSNTSLEAHQGNIGIYSPQARKMRIERFIEKRKLRVWTKKVKYDVRKNFADSRVRVKGRFVKKEEEGVLTGGK